MTENGNPPHIWRPWRFSLRFLLVIVTGIAVWLGYRDFVGVATKKEMVRAALSEELLRRHLTSRSLAASPTPVLAKDFLRPANVDLRILHVGPNVLYAKVSTKESRSPFELEALERIKAGEEEVWKQTWSGGLSYVGRLKTTGSCAACHSSPLGAPSNGQIVDIIVGMNVD